MQTDSLPSEPPEKPKNTRVSSLSLLQRIFLTQELNWGLLHCRQILYYYYEVTSVVADSVQPHRWQPTRLPHPWDSPGKNTGVGCHFLLQGILLTQGSNLHLLSWQAASLPPGKLITGGPTLSVQQHPAEESQGPRLVHWLTPAFSSSERSRSGVPHPSGHHEL